MKVFAITLPDGWVRVDLHDRHALHNLGKRIVALGRLVDQPQMRSLFETKVRPGLDAFAEAGVAAVVLPLSPVFELPVRPLLAIRPLPSADVEPLAYLTVLADGHAQADVWETPTLTGLRTRDVVTGSRPPSDDSASSSDAYGLIELSRRLGIPDDVRLDSLQVGYALGDSEHNDDWLMVQAAIGFPTTEEGRDFAARAERLVDAMVDTVRWVA